MQTFTIIEHQWTSKSWDHQSGIICNRRYPVCLHFQSFQSYTSIQFCTDHSKNWSYISWYRTYLSPLWTIIQSFPWSILQSQWSTNNLHLSWHYFNIFLKRQGCWRHRIYGVNCYIDKWDNTKSILYDCEITIIFLTLQSSVNCIYRFPLPSESWILCQYPWNQLFHGEINYIRKPIPALSDLPTVNQPVRLLLLF